MENRKLNLILLIFLIQSIGVFGQIDTVYLKSDFEITNNIKEARYLRIIQSLNLDGTTNVVDLLNTRQKYFVGSVVYLNGDLQANDYTYYKNGKIWCEGKVDDITQKGFSEYIERTYYPNGQLRSELIETDERFTAAFDSLGNSTMLDGNGVATNESIYTHQLWAGNIKNFKRDSIWTATDTFTGNVTHLEYYDQGKFLKGITLTETDSFHYIKLTSDIPPKAFLRIERDIKRTIRLQVERKDRQRKYIVGLIIENGRPVRVRHLIKNIGEKQLDLDKIQMPTDILYLERGVPVEIFTFVLII
jgi:hypothetical protein